MGKYSDFERKENDKYYTPYDAVVPLIPHIFAPYSARGYKATFVEPCAGDGRLVRHLQKHDHKCLFACDIEPENDPHNSFQIERQDVLFFNYQLPKADLIITNPPWKRETLHEMIEAFRLQMPTWLLFDADWAFTKQSIPYRKHCKYILPVGRISWEGNGVCGKEACAWYLFLKEECETVFL